MRSNVFDCFLFHDEFDTLEIRLAEMDPIVDRFVLVEATETFSNKPKPLYYLDNRSRFDPWKDKIIHVVADNMPNTGNRWDGERYQFNEMLRGLDGANFDDWVIIAPVDEIPKASTLKRHFEIETPDPACLEQTFYWYYFNCEVLCYENPWKGPPVATKLFVEEYLPRGLMDRRLGMLPLIKDGGWHFSYIGGPDAIIHKLESFAHDEFDTDEFKDRETIAQHLANGTDILGRGFDFRFVELDDTFPEHLCKNQERFAAHIRRP